MSFPAQPADLPATPRGGVVAVVGAGAMGSGIAQVAAQAGHEVHLVDAVPGMAGAAVDRLTTALGKLAAKGRITDDEARAAADRLYSAETVADLPECVLVVEAIREDLGDKQDLFRDLSERQSAATLLASNTSSLDITAIGEHTAYPGRVLGLHFFNPVPLMRLVEVVHGKATSPETLAAATSLMRIWGKTPVQCTSTPGFIVNRVARPFYGEAQRMLQDGIADAATLDEALRRAGFRMGPLELTDFIGQDVNLAVGTSVWEQTGRDPRYEPTRLQQELVAAGRLGRKSGQGIYRYASDSARDSARDSASDSAAGSSGPVDAVPDEGRLAELVGGPVETDPVARTLAMLVNEAVDLVARGEASAADVDTAMVLGTNYPLGPIAWGHQIGLDVVRAQLEALDRAYPGGRYRPSPALGLAELGRPR
ncbi:MAG TPA: 3-hydroxyacyl-CoA dehydrogenase NAD-binding domain-containing protein [Dermatophilaceae bacterium]|nr:3-hydroxyacyl-CoA dehydrogenase NAD-binding domain-containing protein [Dermatophilaceae bacterium]